MEGVKKNGRQYAKHLKLILFFLIFRFLVSSLLQKEGSSLEALVEELKVPWRQGTGRMKRMDMKRNGMKRYETE